MFVSSLWGSSVHSGLGKSWKVRGEISGTCSRLCPSASMWAIQKAGPVASPGSFFTKAPTITQECSLDRNPNFSLSPNFPTSADIHTGVVVHHTAFFFLTIWEIVGTFPFLAL